MQRVEAVAKSETARQNTIAGLLSGQCENAIVGVKRYRDNQFGIFTAARLPEQVRPRRRG